MCITFTLIFLFSGISLLFIVSLSLVFSGGIQGILIGSIQFSLLSVITYKILSVIANLRFYTPVFELIYENPSIE